MDLKDSKYLNGLSDSALPESLGTQKIWDISEKSKKFRSLKNSVGVSPLKPLVR